MVRKNLDGEKAGAGQPNTMDRSDEVAQSAGAQGDGAPSVEEVENNMADDAQESVAVEGPARELDEWRDRHLRLAAEFDNFRKRTARESAQANARGQAALAKQLLDPLDDLSRFAHLDPGSVDPSAIVQGVELVERKLLKALGAAGLEVVNPVDQPFNPELHEAVATEPARSPEDDDMVSRVFQQGYVFAGQLLRPARVVVQQWNG
jgi:molecular chaperone GrpE